MKIIIRCSPENIEVAAQLAKEQAGQIERYDRVGYGWEFSRDGARFFVRGLRDGLSVTETASNPPGSPDIRGDR